jgi:hemerythrin
MQWTKQLETGIPSIDEQHKELFRQIDILLDAKNKDRIAETLNFLGDYVKKHFGDEQVMHAKSKYPKATAHKQYHDAFIVTFKTLKDTYNREGPTLANRMAVDKTLIGWLREHILVQDKDFATFYKTSAK